MKYQGIMKVQLPVMTNATGATGLAYNKDRSVQVMFDPAQVKGRMGRHFPESHKGFFYCQVASDGILNIGERAPWQEW